MEYPNIEYILSYGRDKDNNLGLFLLKKSDFESSSESKGKLIFPETDISKELNGHNLDVTEKYITDLYTNKIYSWNDLQIGIEKEKIYLVTNGKNQKNFGNYHFLYLII